MVENEQLAIETKRATKSFRNFGQEISATYLYPLL